MQVEPCDALGDVVLSE